MPKFYCEKCGYSFVPRGKDQVNPPKSCPYCNAKESVVKEKTAHELLDEFTN